MGNKLSSITFKGEGNKLIFYKKLTQQVCKNLKSFVRLSTCERIEIYSDKPVGKIKGMNSLEHPNSTYHLIEIISGTESGLFGELEISSQVKNSVISAKKEGHLSKKLERLFSKAFKISKIVRSKFYLNNSWISEIENKIKSKSKIFIYGEGDLSISLKKRLVKNFELVENKEEAEAIIILKKGLPFLEDTNKTFINLTNKRVSKSEIVMKDFFINPKKGRSTKIKEEIRKNVQSQI